jgi:hypothetical protein
MYVIFALIIISIPVYLAFRSILNDKTRHKGSQAVKDAFKRSIKRHRLSISDVDRFGSRLIALDEDRAKLVLIVYKNGVTWEKCIDLDEIVFCQLVKTTSKVHSGIKEVNMELTLRNDPVSMSFAFFDEELDDTRDLFYRFKKSKYWKRKIQFQLGMRQVTPLGKADDDMAFQRWDRPGISN